MNHNNHTHSILENYEANQPKLLWLLVLIPVAGIFALYTIFRIRNKENRRKLQLEEGTTIVMPTNMRNIIPIVPPSINIFNYYNHTNNSLINNRSDISLVRLPQSEGLYVSVENNAEERTILHERSRRGSSTISAPPPVYSICSPPRYEELVDLRTKDNTAPNST